MRQLSVYIQFFQRIIQKFSRRERGGVRVRARKINSILIELCHIQINERAEYYTVSIERSSRRTVIFFRARRRTHTHTQANKR